MLFYHFSLVKFNHLKIMHPYVEYGNLCGDISLLLTKPTKTGISKLRKNGFTSWGKVDEPYYIYTIDLEPHIDSILGYTITSIPEEWGIREVLNKSGDEWTEEQKIWLIFLETKRRGDPIFPKFTIKEYFNSINCYNYFTKGIRKHWLNFSYYVDEQIKRCNELGKYHNLYAAFIPHVIVKCKADIMIKPMEIKEGK